MRRRVYIAGPITKGNLADNIDRATAAFLALAAAGLAPLCPHWSAFSGGCRVTPGGSVYALAGATPNALTHEDWLSVDVSWVVMASAVLRLPGESAGADIEVATARDHGIPVFESVADVIRWAGA